MAKDETTPIGDEAQAAAAAQPTETTKPADSAPDAEPTDLGYLKDADEADVTHFEEDDDPQQFSGDPVEDN